MSDTGSVTRRLIPSVFDRDSYPLEPNFCLSQALTGHGCLQEYLYYFHLSPSSSCSCREASQDYFHILYICADLDGLRRVFKVTPNTPQLSAQFLKFAAMTVRRLWRAEQLLPRCRHRRRASMSNTPHSQPHTLPSPITVV